MISGLNGLVPVALQQPELLKTQGGAGTGGGSSFADAFKTALSGMEQLSTGANQQVATLLQGKTDTDLGQVSVAVEKADIAFQFMLQVRNKVVSAYQEMEKMQF